MTTFSDKVKHIDFKATVLVEKLSDALTGAIVEGILKGGDKLVEHDLKDQFGISRSPIREAFRVLERKGLVEIIPRKGAFVKTITQQDIEDHFPVRSVLEGLAAKEAYPVITADQIGEMADMLGRMKAAVKKKDAMSYFKRHFRFHEIFIDASDNQLLINLLKNLRMHMMWYRFSYRYYQEDFAKSYRIHEKILKMFKSKNTDPAGLEALVRDHIAEAVEKFIGYLKERNETS